jgi:hypothetical protein
MLCCESTTDERSAGNRHATFCGSRERGTAPGDPVDVETELRRGYLGTARRKRRQQTTCTYDHRATSRLYRDEPVDYGGARRQVKRPSNLHQNQTTSVDERFRGRPPLRPLARELLRFAREVAWPPRLAKIAAMDREGSIAGRIAVISPCTLICMSRSSSSIADPSGHTSSLLNSLVGTSCSAPIH